MKVVPMKAERRTALGRNQVAQLRSQGWMPAVVYGEGKESLSIAISEWELEQHLKAHHKVFQLDIGGTPQSAFLQSVDFNAIDDRPLHADFKRIDLTKEIEADVEVSLLGYPVGLGRGGALVKDHMAVKLRCLPTAIPEELEHDISGLDVDQVLTAGQLALPAGVSLVSPEGMPICHVAKLAGTQSTAADAAAADDKAAKS